MDASNPGAAALAVAEWVLWHLAVAGVIDPKKIALDLERSADRLARHGEHDAASRVRVLATMVRAAEHEDGIATV